MISPIGTALQFFKRRNYKLPEEFSRSLVEAIKSGRIHSRALKQAPEYQGIRDVFWSEVYNDVWVYLSTDASIVSSRNDFKKGIADAWVNAADSAYTDGGAELPLDEDTLSWVESEQSAQLGYADSFFQTLKDLKKEGDFDAIQEAYNAAERWASSLDGLYNSVKVRAAGNVMLTFDGDDGAESCDPCQTFKGQRHRASWWIAHNAVPPRGSALDCANGGKCEHRLYDDAGNEFTI